MSTLLNRLIVPLAVVGVLACGATPALAGNGKDARLSIPTARHAITVYAAERFDPARSCSRRLPVSEGCREPPSVVGCKHVSARAVACWELVAGVFPGSLYWQAYARPVVAAVRRDRLLVFPVPPA